LLLAVLVEAEVLELQVRDDPVVLVGHDRVQLNQLRGDADDLLVPLLVLLRGRRGRLRRRADVEVGRREENSECLSHYLTCPLSNNPAGGILRARASKEKEGRPGSCRADYRTAPPEIRAGGPARERGSPARPSRPAR